MSNPEITLPFGITGVGGGETLHEGEAVAVDVERLIELALLNKYVAGPLIGDREIALPLPITWIGSCEALLNGKAVTRGTERLIELALSRQDVGQVILRYG
jgi:hypothetical protein